MAFKQKFAIFLLASLLVAGSFFWQPEKLNYAPDVVFKTIKGEIISLAKLKGKPVLITFWASDCSSCIKEIPLLISLHQQYSTSGLTIIAVAMFYDPPNLVLQLTTEKQLPYSIALDPQAEHAKAFGNVQFTPTSFLIDKNGLIVLQKTGLLDLPSIQERLNNI